ncbi:DHHC zinc finger domain containing protein [Trichomonas vaginalis G3]|uniref:Palmitoyltransferase n=2 Tax=Trichomonas vaginalis (strain ATCC PRA-98 / G3) TaxID=412133 RepID=A2G5E3_TRIV3|nr:cysteine S-palmitoyltransferase protein [Trichomonas vaginalis G3]EAX87625.1 DHHC zinc finger domain containing protein [Trichomonas vaginalis G3]KAI5543606.1 cysteine S-palmitoyltransferase protein [Trichomonas vaginalis G3]|eukprot:XP_001300555.1 DHHC zinc finger domain containing protein [Trichomonas vaginalis G3]
MIGYIIIAYILFIAFATFVMIYGNNSCVRNTFIGSIYRFFANTLPNWFIAKYKKIFNIPDSPDHNDTCMGKNGPCRYFILISFALLYAGLVADYWFCTYPYIHIFYKNLFLHKILSVVLPAIPWIIIIALQFLDPGVITSKNVIGYMKKYPFDFILYNHKVCRTLHIPAVARSRYCNYTQRRIAKYDHYCPWVVASIGERTHRWFLLFLVGCVVASAYYLYADLYVTFLIMYAYYQKIKWTNSFKVNAQIFAVVLIKEQKFNAFCEFLFFFIIIFLVIFIGQQIYFISTGRTTIELDKWGDYYYKHRNDKSKKPVKNMYDYGFIHNWKEFLFPEPVPECEEWVPDKYWKKIIENEEKRRKELNSKPKNE